MAETAEQTMVALPWQQGEARGTLNLPASTKVLDLGQIQISCPRREYFFHLCLSYFSSNLGIFLEISSLTE